MGVCRPNSMRDKTMCYILVLLMLASDYQIDLDEISKDVKYGVKKLQDFSRVLAFTPTGSDKFSMILKMPLPAAFTVLHSPKKRGRK